MSLSSISQPSVASSGYILDSVATVADKSAQLGCSSLYARNSALKGIAEAIQDNRKEILKANDLDVSNARSRGVKESLIDRLSLSQGRLNQMCKVLFDVVALPDLIGQIENIRQLESGIRVGKMRTPIGVIAFIYESRPGVTIEASALAIKSGNALLLKGGSDAKNSNEVIVSCVHAGLRSAQLPTDSIRYLQFSDYSMLDELLALDQYIDVVIPRGGKDLIDKVVESTRIPVLRHSEGICHLYVDKDANLDMAVDLAFHSKTFRYGICSCLETLLVDQQIAAQYLPKIAKRLMDHGVELRVCMRAKKHIEDAQCAQEEDWSTEYLAPILSIRVVDDLCQAVEHIERYGSHHTDTIVTESVSKAQAFMRQVSSSSVMVNASTTFADGGQYGLGAEIGISTNKLHARGPVGLEGLSSYKYVVFGEGQWRS